MYPYYPYNPQSGDDAIGDEQKKIKIRALLESMDDGALLRLGLMLQERGLMNIEGLQQQLPATSCQLPLETQSPHLMYGVNHMQQQLEHAQSLSSSASVVGSPPVKPLPPGPVISSFSTHRSMQSEFTPSTASSNLNPLGTRAPSDVVYAESADNVEIITNGQEDGDVEEKNKIADGSYTTLILRNFPVSFDQDKARQWVADLGYEDKYDFFLWFPPKSGSRIGKRLCGYAFVNFRSTEFAQRFLEDHHMARFPADDGDVPEASLNVAVAKVQGFAKNYTRFLPMLEGDMHTMCTPFFAQDSIQGLTQSEACDGLAKPVSPMHMPSADGATTIVLRNLPGSIENTDMMKHWLDKAGYASQYDFISYLPAKKQRKHLTGHTALGYAFVNFKLSSDALSCMKALQGTMHEDGEVPLNIVPAKIQGRSQCINHFSSIVDGRCKPWLERLPPRTSFQ